MLKNLSSAGFTKKAAPKWVKLFQEGKLTEAKAGHIARKLNLPSRTLKHLGQGAEGTVDLITHPKTRSGLATMKTYDKRGLLYTPKIFNKK